MKTLNTMNNDSRIPSKMRILILTGNQTFAEIYKICSNFNQSNKKNKFELQLDVGIIDTPVSAFITKDQVRNFFGNPKIIKKLSSNTISNGNFSSEFALDNSEYLDSDESIINFYQFKSSLELVHIPKPKGYISKEYDMILLPGFVPWDASNISEELNIPIFKGTRFMGDLPDLFKNIKNIKLSHRQAADELINKNLSITINELILNEISIIKNKFETAKLSKTPGEIPYENIIKCYNNKTLYNSDKLPPLIFAEIVNAPKLSESVIFSKIEHYLNSGADVIDIGTIFGQDDSEFLSNIIPKIHDRFNCPISIDSVDIKEIKTALKAGVDFILSIDAGNIDDFLELVEKEEYDNYNYPIQNIGLILVPLSGKNHYPEKELQSRFKILTDLTSKLNEKGFNNIFYDLLLKTPIKPGFTQSLIEFYQFKNFLKQIGGIEKPFFMGFNNVFELIDGDSPGINTLLTTIAMELGVGGILTTEYSAKSIGAIFETKKSVDLIYLAKMKKVPPINLGLNAFNIKSKIRSVKRLYDIDSKILINKREIVEITENIKVLTEKFGSINPKDYKYKKDKNGYFQIYADHQKHQIEAIFYPSDKFKKEHEISDDIHNLLISGVSAEEIYKTIDRLQLISEISHAFYIGKELSRAEHAIKHNSYYQEDIDD